MKKFTLVLVLTGLFLSTNLILFSQAQQGPASIGKGGAQIMSDRAGELDCPENSIFSQPPVGYTTGYYSDEGTFGSVQKLYENFFGLTSLVGGITIWGILWNGGDCYTGGSDDFVVAFYQDNAGAVGTMVQTFDLTVTPIVTGSTVGGANILRYNITLPSNISLASGWVEIYRKNPGNSSCVFGWLDTVNGDSSIAFSQNGGLINYYGVNLAFCLTGPTIPGEVPISNWALFIGIGLILAFTVVRFRKMV
jgi:hypothetical protein